MNESSELSVGRGKRAVFAGVLCLMLLALGWGGGELVARAMGYRPWEVRDTGIKASPGGKLFRLHPSLGYTALPGAFTLTLADGYAFRVTHLADGHRITRPLSTYTNGLPKPQIWVFGCSYTYGWSVNDEDTYPWRLQARFPGYDVVNFGMNGYGTIHALIQLREALKSNPPPAVAIVTYGNFHDDRNTFIRERRKAVVPWNRLGPLCQPCARLDGQGHLQESFRAVEYRAFPLSTHSALMHFLELKYNQLEERFSRSHLVSRAILAEMATLAQQAHFPLVVAGISEHPLTREMLGYLSHKGVLTVDMAVDLGRPGYSNQPHDGHPSALTHAVYAARLEQYLCSNRFVSVSAYDAAGAQP